MWPWSKIKRLEQKLRNVEKSYSEAASQIIWLQRTIEMIDPETVTDAKEKVNKWSRKQNQMSRASIWTM